MNFCGFSQHLQSFHVIHVQIPNIPGPMVPASHCQPEEPQCCPHEGSAPDAGPVEIPEWMTYIHSTVYLYYVSPQKSGISWNISISI